jgi:hypothetical protein
MMPKCLKLTKVSFGTLTKDMYSFFEELWVCQVGEVGGAQEMGRKHFSEENGKCTL